MNGYHFRRVSAVVPYAACFAATWGLIGLEPRLRLAEVAVAFVLQVLVGVLIAYQSRFGDGRVGLSLGMVAFLGSVALLRDGVGPTPGYGSLLLLPIMWAAVRSRRGELAWAIAGAAVVLFAPIVVIGSAHYPESGWRSGGLLVVIAAILGVTVLTLVDSLRASESRHRLLAENSTDLVARFALDGKISYASPASRALLGLEPAELLGRTIAELKHPDDRTGWDELVARIDTASETTVVESRLRHRDGRYLWFEATVRPVLDAEGRITERQAAIRMLEERKRLQLAVEHQRDAANEMLATQNALRQVATLVAGGAESGTVFDAIAEQLARLCGGTLGGVIRFDVAAGVGEIVGGWTLDGTDITGQTIDLDGTTAAAQVYRTGRAVEIDRYRHRATEPIVNRYKLGVAICAPVTVGGTVWGSVGTSFVAGETIPPHAGDRLAQFTELIAVALASAQARETLTHQAATDPVTGLANYRAFHERLRTELQRASRHGRALSIGVFDLDHFEQINDNYGHQSGDRVLAEVARRLTSVARTGEVVARTGGEEFAWLMPETDRDGAYQAADRARRAIEAAPFEEVGTLTISAGVCSNEHTRTAQELFSAADEALYRAKQSGRNRTVTHGPGVMGQRRPVRL